MLALFGGTGDLPGAIVSELSTQQRDYVVCEMAGFPVANVEGSHKIPFRLEHLGRLLADLRGRGVTEVCFAGAVRRPEIDPAEIDPATLPLIPRLMDAIVLGDDGALRGIIALFEAEGFVVVAAHDLVPGLLPDAGVLVGAAPDKALLRNLSVAMTRHLDMSEADSGQAVIVSGGHVVASEGPEGTDAMLAAFAGAEPISQPKSQPGGIAGIIGQFVADVFGGGTDPAGPDDDAELLAAFGGVLYKAPKLGQDRRADLPVIGPDTVELAARCGLASIVIEAGGVMVLKRDETVRLAERYGIRLWVREAGA